MPAGLTWSPDGKTLFTRAVRHERTWTAWDAVTGKRLYDLQPTGFVTGDDWKMMPGPVLHPRRQGDRRRAGEGRNRPSGPGRERTAGRSTRRRGKCLRRLGDPLPGERFQWAYPIAVDPDGSTVVMQVYTISGPPATGRGPGHASTRSREYTFHTTRWDPVKGTALASGT